MASVPAIYICNKPPIYPFRAFYYYYSGFLKFHLELEYQNTCEPFPYLSHWYFSKKTRQKKKKTSMIDLMNKLDKDGGRKKYYPL